MALTEGWYFDGIWAWSVVEPSGATVEVLAADLSWQPEPVDVHVHTRDGRHFAGEFITIPGLMEWFERRAVEPMWTANLVVIAERSLDALHDAVAYLLDSDEAASALLRYDATSTLLYIPEASCLEASDKLIDALHSASLQVETAASPNPIAWLDRSHTGVFLRLHQSPVSRRRREGEGVEWEDDDQADAVLALAEALALRTKDRWYALFQNDGRDEECTEVLNVSSFEAFRALLQEREQSPRPQRPPPACSPHRGQGVQGARPLLNA